MPILIVLGLFSVYGVVSFAGSCKTNAKTRTKTQSEHIADQMIGKSKSECRKFCANTDRSVIKCIY